MIKNCIPSVPVSSQAVASSDSNIIQGLLHETLLGIPRYLVFFLLLYVCWASQFFFFFFS